MCVRRDGLQNTVLLCYVQRGRSNETRGETQMSQVKCVCAVRDGLQNTVPLYFVEGGRSNKREVSVKCAGRDGPWDKVLLCYVEGGRGSETRGETQACVYGMGRS